MKIAVFSDIHDHVWNLAKALEKAQQAEAMICCGDLCSPFVVNLLARGFPDRPIHVVFGNNDGDLYRIGMVAGQHAHVNLHGEFFRGDIAGLKFAAQHYDNMAGALARSGEFDVVCYGHDHRYRIETVGSCLAINPGTIMGYEPRAAQEVPATFVLYDTVSGQASRVLVAD